MLKSKTLIAIAIICSAFLLVFINSSDAIEIEVMRPADGLYEVYDWGGGAFHMGAYIKTDKDISYVDWYVNGKYERASMPNSGTTELYYYPNTLTGDIRGIKYRIKAVVWRYDDQGNMHSDSDSYTLRVYKLEVETKVHGGGGQQHLNVSGYVELSRHYHDGWNIVMEGWVSARNGSNDIITCRASFKHTWDKKPFDPQEHAAPTVNCGPGESYGPYYTDPMILNFHVGGPIKAGKTYKLNAHIHLETGLDHRHVDSTNTFTDEHNQ